jgi:hypothetical protein
MNLEMYGKFLSGDYKLENEQGRKTSGHTASPRTERKNYHIDHNLVMFQLEKRWNETTG